MQTQSAEESNLIANEANFYRKKSISLKAIAERVIDVYKKI